MGSSKLSYNYSLKQQNQNFPQITKNHHTVHVIFQIKA